MNTQIHFYLNDGLNYFMTVKHKHKLGAESVWQELSYSLLLRTSQNTMNSGGKDLDRSQTIDVCDKQTDIAS